MKVTIGIPVRNGVEHLKYTLPCYSALDYSKDEYEIIFVNHGSTDGSLSLLNEFCEKNSNARVLSIPFLEPNRSHVRNVIISSASNELLIFVDQDVLVMPDFITQHVTIHEEREHCLVSGQIFGKEVPFESHLMTPYLNDIQSNIETIKNDSNFSDFRVVNGLVSNEKKYTVFDNNTRAWRFFWTTNMSIKKRDISNNLFDENFHGWGVEDEEFSYRQCLSGNELIYSRDAFGIHNPHPVNSDSNDLTWHINMNYFVDKNSNRELEFYYMFLIFLDKELASFNFNLNRVNKRNVEEIYTKFLQEKHEINCKRIAFQLDNIPLAKKLGCTHVFNPYLDCQKTPQLIDGVMEYSLFGIRTPFENNYFDEGVVVLSSLLPMSLPFSRLFLIELFRICVKVIILHDSETQIQDTHLGKFFSEFNKELVFVNYK